MKKGYYSTVYRCAYFGRNKCLVPVECYNSGYFKRIEGRCDKCVAMACVDADLEDLFGSEMRGSLAITLHFSGCNMDCKFCWAYPVKNRKEFIKEREAEDVVEDIKCMCEEINNSRNLPKSKKEIRALVISGNEPLIQISHIVCLMSTIKETLPLIENFSENLKILVRTNGTLVRKNIRELKALRATGLDVKFQVSFKGVNPDQFSTLTGRPAELFKEQFLGYKQLIRIFGETNVFPTLGISHAKKLYYSHKLYNFSVDIVFPDGRKMDFTDFDREILDQDLIKEFSGSDLHQQYFEWFPTLKSKKNHNPDISEIIRITCPGGVPFRCDFVDLRKACELIASCNICNSQCKGFIAALHGKNLKAVRTYDAEWSIYDSNNFI